MNRRSRPYARGPSSPQNSTTSIGRLKAWDAKNKWGSLLRFNIFQLLSYGIPKEILQLHSFGILPIYDWTNHVDRPEWNQEGNFVAWQYQETMTFLITKDASNEFGSELQACFSRLDNCEIQTFSALSDLPDGESALVESMFRTRKRLSVLCATVFNKSVKEDDDEETRDLIKDIMCETIASATPLIVTVALHDYDYDRQWLLYRRKTLPQMILDVAQQTIKTERYTLEEVPPLKNAYITVDRLKAKFSGLLTFLHGLRNSPILFVILLLVTLYLGYRIGFFKGRECRQ